MKGEGKRKRRGMKIITCQPCIPLAFYYVVSSGTRSRGPNLYAKWNQVIANNNVILHAPTHQPNLPSSTNPSIHQSIHLSIYCSIPPFPSSSSTPPSPLRFPLAIKNRTHTHTHTHATDNANNDAKPSQANDIPSPTSLLTLPRLSCLKTQKRMRIAICNIECQKAEHIKSPSQANAGEKVSWLSTYAHMSKTLSV